MPGIRCDQINDPEWPRTLHDKQITGFSPLVCGMKDAPVVWRTIDVGGELGSVDEIATSDGTSRLLVNDGRLRLMERNGRLVWTADDRGKLVFAGDLRGNGRD